MTGNYKFAPAVVIFFARGSSVLIWFRGYGNYFLRIAPIPPLNGINMALASFLFNCCELKWGEVRWGGEWSAAPHMWAYLFWFDPLGPERWWFSNGLEYLQSFCFLNKRFNWLFMSFFIVFYCKKHSQGGGNTRNWAFFVGIKPAFNARTKRTKKLFKSLLWMRRLVLQNSNPPIST